MPTAQIEGQAVIAYGHSYVAGAGASTEPWLSRAARRLGFGSSANRGVSGDRIEDTVTRILGYTGNGSQGSGSSSMLWTSGTRSLVILECFMNDVRSGGATALNQAGVANGLRSALAILSGNARVPCSDSSHVFTGTWTANTLADYGAIKYTTAQSAHVDISFTGTEITHMAFGLTGAASGATVSYILDPSGANTTLATVNLSGQGIDTTPLANPKGYVAAFQRFTGLASGSHVLRVTKTDSGSGSVYDGGHYTPLSAPPFILVLMDPELANWTLYSPYNNGSSSARLTIYGAVQSVVSQFGNAFCIDLDSGWDTGSMIYSGDNVHPNDKGTAHIVDLLQSFLGAISWTPGLHEL